MAVSNYDSALRPDTDFIANDQIKSLVGASIVSESDGSVWGLCEKLSQFDADGTQIGAPVSYADPDTFIRDTNLVAGHDGGVLVTTAGAVRSVAAARDGRGRTRRGGG